MGSDKMILWLSLLGIFAVPGALGLGYFIFQKDRQTQRATLADLAAELELTPVEGSDKYTGRLENRTIELFPTVKSNSTSRGFRLAGGFRVYLAQDFPHLGYARCARKGGDTTTYEAAFSKARIGLETLNPAQKKALASFVTEHGNLFLEAEEQPAYLETTFSTFSKQNGAQQRLLQLSELAEVLESP